MTKATIAAVAMVGLCLFGASEASARGDYKMCVNHCQAPYSKPLKTCQAALAADHKRHDSPHAKGDAACVAKNQKATTACRAFCNG